MKNYYVFEDICKMLGAYLTYPGSFVRHIEKCSFLKNSVLNGFKFVDKRTPKCIEKIKIFRNVAMFVLFLFENVLMKQLFLKQLYFLRSLVQRKMLVENLGDKNPRDIFEVLKGPTQAF